MPEPQDEKRTRLQRWRRRRQERREKAAARAQLRAEEGITGNALTDHSRRRPDQFGHGG
jgi:hypothetical protein